MKTMPAYQILCFIAEITKRDLHKQSTQNHGPREKIRGLKDIYNRALFTLCFLLTFFLGGDVFHVLIFVKSFGVLNSSF